MPNNEIRLLRVLGASYIAPTIPCIVSYSIAVEADRTVLIYTQNLDLICLQD